MKFRTRQQTEYDAIAEYQFTDIQNIKIKNDRIDRIQNHFNNYGLKIDWETIKPILEICSYLPLKTKKQKSINRPTIKNGGFVANLETVAMFPYSKRIHLYEIIDNSGKKRKSIFVEYGWEVNHVDGNKFNNLRGNLEVMPIWLNVADYRLKELVKHNKITIREMDTLITKYRKLCNKTKTYEELINLEELFWKEVKNIRRF